MTFSFASIRRIAARPLCAALLVGLASCSAGSDSLNGPDGAASSTLDLSRSFSSRIIASVSVTPSASTMNAGQLLQLTAVALSSSGGRITGNLVAWKSSDAKVVTVSWTGLVKAVAPGTASVIATVAGKADTAQITVAGATSTLPGTVSNLSVTGTTDTSATLRFTQVTDGAGGAANYAVGFSVAPLSAPTAVAVSQGTCALPVAGTSVGAPLTCTVLGLAAGTAYQFQVVALRGTSLQNAVTGGLSNIASGTTTAPVVTAPVAPSVGSVVVSPATATSTVGVKLPLSATVRDKNNNVMAGQHVSWSSSNNSIATVDTAGATVGVAPGTVTFAASVAGVSGTATVTEAAAATAPPAPTVGSVTVTPATANAAVGTALSLTATVKDNNSNPMTGQVVTWTSSNNAIATVNASGVTMGVAPGTVKFTASVAGVSGTATVTEAAPAPPAPTVASVTVSPATSNATVGVSLSLSATVKDQNNNVMSGQTVSWKSSNTAVATVNGSGTTLGVAAGTVTITATVAGVSGTATVSEAAAVQPPPPAPNGMYPNQPAGLTRFAELDFSGLPGVAGIHGCGRGQLVDRTRSALAPHHPIGCLCTAVTVVRAADRLREGHATRL